ncbi:hypothetical protein Pta6605_54130 [Pseudomonas amygdali pv. tabaci]|nr:hypothetical protein Pta6605_54130 [Pseudomonas amygdali pv. tabaci]
MNGARCNFADVIFRAVSTLCHTPNRDNCRQTLLGALLNITENNKTAKADDAFELGCIVNSKKGGRSGLPLSLFIRSQTTTVPAGYGSDR